MSRYVYRGFGQVSLVLCMTGGLIATASATCWCDPIPTAAPSTATVTTTNFQYRLSCLVLQVGAVVAPPSYNLPAVGASYTKWVNTTISSAGSALSMMSSTTTTYTTTNLTTSTSTTSTSTTSTTTTTSTTSTSSMNATTTTTMTSTTSTTAPATCLCLNSTTFTSTTRQTPEITTSSTITSTNTSATTVTTTSTSMNTTTSTIDNSERNYTTDKVNIVAIIDLAPLGFHNDEDIFYLDGGRWNAHIMNDRIKKAYVMFVDWINDVRGGVFVQGKWRPLSLTAYDANDRKITGSESLVFRRLQTDSASTMQEKLGPHETGYLQSVVEAALADPDHNFLLGPVGFGEVEAVAAIAQERGALTLMPSLGHAQAFKGRDMVFGMWPDFRTATWPAFNALNGTSGATASSVVFLTVEDSSQEFACEFVPDYAKSVQPPMTYKGYRYVKLNNTRRQLKETSDWLRQADADLVILCVPDTTCSQMISFWRFSNYNPPSLSVFGSCLYDIDEDAVPYMLASTSWASQFDFKSKLDPAWTGKSFHHSYIHKFGPTQATNHEHADLNSMLEPQPEGAAAFAALEVLVTAIEAADSLDPMLVREELISRRFETIFGNVSFNDDGLSNRSYKLIQVDQVLDFAIVGPISEKEADLMYPIPTWAERPCKVGNEFDPRKDRSRYGFHNYRKTEHMATLGLNKSTFLSAVRFAATEVFTGSVDPDSTVAAGASGWVAYVEKIWPKKKGPTPQQVDSYVFLDLEEHLADLDSTAFGKQFDQTMIGVLTIAVMSYLYTLTGNDICAPCPSAGKFDTTLGVRVCFECSSIQVLRGSGMSTYCEDLCSAGSGIDLTTGECTQCTKGKFSDSSQCTNCTYGRFSNASNKSSCPDCPHGRSAFSEGSTACDLCSVGYEAASYGLQNCTRCSRGTVSDRNGTEYCRLCESGSIANATGMTACHICQPGSYSDWGATGCSLCPVGRYQNLPNETICKTANLKGAHFDKIGMVKGNNTHNHWTRQEGTMLTWEYCNFVPDACIQGERCSEGATGIHCAACMPGYYSPSLRLHEACAKCPHYALNYVFTGCGFILMWLCGMGLGRLAIASSRKPNEIHVALIKILFHYGFTLGVLFMVMQKIIDGKRENLKQGTAQVAMTGGWAYQELIMGRPFLESPWRLFSLSCLFGKDDVALKEKLSVISHSQWFEESFQEHIKQLGNIHLQSEERLLMFWAVIPAVSAVAIYSFSFIRLMIHFMRHRSRYSEANQFYNDLIKEGAAYVSANYEPAALVPHFQAYKAHVAGIWWPFNYLQASHRQGCCYRRRTFGGETKPVVLATFLFVFAPALFGLLRVWNCGVYGDYDGTKRMMHSNTLECGAYQSLNIWSIGGCIVWGIFFPIVIFVSVHVNKGELLHEAWWKTENSVLIIGYNGQCAWWEAVVFFDKFIQAFSAHMGSDASYAVLIQMLIALLYGALTVMFKPFDKRRNNILWKISCSFIGVRVVVCIVLEMLILSEQTQAWILLFGGALILNLFYVFFVFRILWKVGVEAFISSYGEQEGLSWLVVPGIKLKKSRYCWDMIKDRVMKRIYLSSHKQKYKQPYVSFDHLLGWVTLIGNRGDLAVNPSIDRGSSSPNKSGRPDLSEAPLYPSQVPQDAGVTIANNHQIKYLHRVISDTMHSVMTGLRHGSTFSVSLMEFTIRMGFFFGRKHSLELVAAGSKKDDETDAPMVDTNALPDFIVELATDDTFERAGQMNADSKHAEKFLQTMHHPVAGKMTEMHAMGRVKNPNLAEKSRSLAHIATGRASTIVSSQVKQVAMDQEEEGLELLDDVETTLELLLDEIKNRTKRPTKKKKRRMRLLGGVDTTLDQAGAAETIGAQVTRSLAKGFKSGTTMALNGGLTAATGQASASPEADTADARQHTMAVSAKHAIQYDLTNAKKGQLEHWVRVMLNPHLYSKGIRLELFQQGLLRMQMMRRSEITYMLDQFEEAWCAHMTFKATILKRYAGMTKDVPCHADMEAPKPEITLNDLEDRVSQELKFGRYKPKADDPVRTARVAFKWAHLSMLRGDIFSSFNSTHLVSAVKHNFKRKYRMMTDEVQKEADALQKAKEKLAALSPELAKFLSKPGLAISSGAVLGSTGAAADSSAGGAGVSISAESTAVVTGAASGIGAEFALLLAQHGVQVVAVDSNVSMLHQLPHANIAQVLADIGTAAGVQKVMNVVKSRKVNVLAHVAGVLHAKPLLAIDRGSVNQMVGAHMYGPTFLTAALRPNLTAAGGARVLLMTTSVGGCCGLDAEMPTFGGYGATQAALKNLWLALRVECTGFAHVALCSPGFVKTPVWDKYLADTSGNSRGGEEPVWRDRFQTGDYHTATEVAQWMAAMLKSNPTMFSEREHNIDDPEHQYGVAITLTSEGKGFANRSEMQALESQITGTEFARN